MRRVVGIDAGTNSLGWVVFDEPEDPDTDREILAAGVRIFPSVLDPKKKTPLNAERRTFRGQRRNIYRRGQRMRNLKRLLEKELNASPDPLLNPYQLRKEAIERQLDSVELATALFHLGHRRGFQSNRKTFQQKYKIRSTEEEDPEAVLAEQTEDKEEGRKLAKKLKELREKSSGKLLGQYFHSIFGKERIRGSVKHRDDLRKEFEQIWQAQRSTNSKFKQDLENLLFGQRPLKSQRGLIGKCTYEPDQTRSPKCMPLFQEFNIWKTVNNLKATQNYHDLPIMPDQRQELAKELMVKEKLSWATVRKLLGHSKDTTYNLEKTHQNELPGNKTAVEMIKIMGEERWVALASLQRNQLVHKIRSTNNKRKLEKSLRFNCKFPQEIAEKLSLHIFQDGYGNLSRKAMEKMLPHLQHGLNEHDAAQAAGYKRRDQITIDAQARLPMPPDLRNPTLNKALVETRKLVNAIIREYGKPDLIRIEFARELKLGKKALKAIEDSIKKNEDSNKEADKFYAGLGHPVVNRTDRIKYRLWKECGEKCPYTLRPITASDLLNGNVHIEHIIPFSRSWDDSFNNKTLAFAEVNQLKGNRTPFEAFGQTDKWPDLVENMRQNQKFGMKKHKVNLFCREQFDEDKFVNRQLSDTSYIAVAVREYLEQLGVEVQTVSGKATAWLRHKWGLNTILNPNGEDEKTRDDHRHHLIDAAVVALTTPAITKRISDIAKLEMEKVESINRLNVPQWPSLRSSLESLAKDCIVSHAPKRDISGGLHDPNPYARKQYGAEEKYSIRKPISAMSKGEIEAIVDGMLKKKLIQAISNQAGIDWAKLEGDAYKKALKSLLGEDETFRYRDKIGQRELTARRARILKSEGEETFIKMGRKKDDSPRWYPIGDYHHVEILECLNDCVADGKKYKKGQRRGVFVSTWEAAHRARRDKKALVQRDHGPNWRFVMSLCKGDLIEMTGEKSGLFRVVAIHKTNNRVRLIPLSSADTSDEFNRGINVLHGEKINIDPLGRKHLAND